MSNNESIPRHIEQGIRFGLIKKKYNFKDYIQEAAITKSGYETVIVDGVQRAGKSNCSMQISSWAKEATLRVQRGDKWLEPGWDNPEPVNDQDLWNKVIADTVYKTGDFVETLEAVPINETKDSLLWDDIGAHFTNTKFKINPEEYSAIDSTFTVVGTACHVIISNIPNVNRLARNIKDNATFEIFIGKNKLRKMMRLFRLPGTKRIEMNLFKVDVEPPSDFNIYNIPAWAWEKYELKRRELAKEALQVLRSTANIQSMDGYLTMKDAVKLCADHGVNWGIQSIQQLASRQVFPKQIINDRLCVEKSGLLDAIETETLYRVKKKKP